MHAWVCEREVGNSCIDLVLFAQYSEQKCKPWEHLERGETGGRGAGGGSSAIGSEPSIHAHTHIYTHRDTSMMCGGSLGSQSAALNKAFLFLRLIAVSICHWGVQFLISALTESGEVDVGRNTKWMHLLTNEIKPLHLHFSFFRQLEQCCFALALRTLSYFPLTSEKARLTYSQIVRTGSEVWWTARPYFCFRPERNLM